MRSLIEESAWFALKQHLDEGGARRTVKKAMGGEAPTNARGKRAVKAALAKSPSKQKKIGLDVAAKVYDNQMRHADVEDLHEILPLLAPLAAGAAAVGGAAARVGGAAVKTVGKIGAATAKGALKLGKKAVKVGAGAVKGGAKKVAGELAATGVEQKLKTMKFQQAQKAQQQRQPH